MADTLTERLPLQMMLDCLQVRLHSPNPQRAHAAGLLRTRRVGLFGDGDESVNGIEVLVTLADELCGRPHGAGRRRPAVGRRRVLDRLAPARRIDRPAQAAASPAPPRRASLPSRP